MVLATLALAPGLTEPYQLPKALALMIGALLLVAVAIWQLTVDGAMEVPRAPVVALAIAVPGVMALSAVLHDRIVLSAVGEYGRSAGVLTYAAVLLIYLAVLVAVRPADVRLLAWTFVLLAVPVVAYGLLNAVGREPMSVEHGIKSVTSTLGQQNFVAGYLGVLLPFIAWAFSVTTNVRRRVGLSALGAATLLTAVLTHSFQAFPGVISGLAFFGLVVTARRLPRHSFRLIVLSVVVALALVGVVGHSRIERELRSSLDERVLMWQAARDMVVDSPLLGKGPAGYAAHFTEYRPRAHAVRFGPFQIVDAPHSVPLGMAVSGGLILGALYLAFVVGTGFMLAQGLRRTWTAEPDRALLLAAFGGAWLAYQVQSTVSIDVPTLILAHFVTAAAIGVLSYSVRTVTFTVPWAGPQRTGRGYSASGGGMLLRGAVGLLVLAGSWLALLPTRADAAFADTQDLRSSGLPEGALSAAERTTMLGGWNGRYWAERAALLAAVGDQDGALAAGQKAAHASPSAVSYALSVAQLAHRMQRDETAEQYFEIALRRAPYVASAASAAAQFFIDTSRPQQGVTLARRAVDIEPLNAVNLLVLARAYDANQDVRRAERVYKRMITLDGKNASAFEGLAELYERTGRPTLARPLWETLLAFQPTNVKAYNALHGG
jgi:putative inorganic carbon (HCO3(-)) transporter